MSSMNVQAVGHKDVRLDAMLEFAYREALKEYTRVGEKERDGAAGGSGRGL
jgi:hypothetical protein